MRNPVFSLRFDKRFIWMGTAAVVATGMITALIYLTVHARTVDAAEASAASIRL
jgi:hypothetical protein